MPAYLNTLPQNFTHISGLLTIHPLPHTLRIQKNLFPLRWCNLAQDLSIICIFLLLLFCVYNSMSPLNGIFEGRSLYAIQPFIIIC